MFDFADRIHNLKLQWPASIITPRGSVATGRAATPAGHAPAAASAATPAGHAPPPPKRRATRLRTPEPAGHVPAASSQKPAGHVPAAGAEDDLRALVFSLAQTVETLRDEVMQGRREQSSTPGQAGSQTRGASRGPKGGGRREGAPASSSDGGKGLDENRRGRGRSPDDHGRQRGGGTDGHGRQSGAGSRGRSPDRKRQPPVRSLAPRPWKTRTVGHETGSKTPRKQINPPQGYVPYDEANPPTRVPRSNDGGHSADFEEVTPQDNRTGFKLRRLGRPGRGPSSRPDPRWPPKSWLGPWLSSVSAFRPTPPLTRLLKKARPD